jgi:hypothetical protein
MPSWSFVPDPPIAGTNCTVRAGDDNATRVTLTVWGAANGNRTEDASQADVIVFIPEGASGTLYARAEFLMSAGNWTQDSQSREVKPKPA